MALTADEIKEYESDVKRPGKFEGQARYIPYFYEVYLDGGADDDDGRVLTFRLNADDKKWFPELKRRKAVKIEVTDYGFVQEV